ncbi:MAG: 6-phosphofructokinase [Clostridiales bacterium]|nr:6-phosphofructokinase [Clostridiales bacterium]
MKNTKRNVLLAQSGGPTAVINASIVGAFERSIASSDIDRVYGAKNGIVGVLQEELIDLTAQKRETMEGLKYTPSSGLGSCRYKLDKDIHTPDYKRIFDVFDAHNIGYFFYNGGNDSMDTALKLSQYAKEIGYPINIMGIPKTVDNDLCGTDHCPGFGSAAKYINTTLVELSYDINVYTAGTVLLFEAMGRHAGWLTASAALSSLEIYDGIVLTYLPEVPFEREVFLSQIEDAYRKHKQVIVVASEGIKDKDGELIAAQEGKVDQFGHKQLGGVCIQLKQIIEENITKRAKLIIPDLIQRSAAHYSSSTDMNEAYWMGYKAVDYALEGKTAFMPGIERLSNNPYVWEPKLVPLEDVANHEKEFPTEWITPEGNFVTKEAIDYVRPLIEGNVSIPERNGLPRYHKLDKTLMPKRLDDYEVE